MKPEGLGVAVDVDEVPMSLKVALELFGAAFNEALVHGLSLRHLLRRLSWAQSVCVCVCVCVCVRVRACVCVCVCVCV